MQEADRDAVLVLSFGGPEKPEDVMPFLENVTRGRGIPRERLEEVAEHYYHFGGKSPINDQNRALIAALEDLLRNEGPQIPVYWGNRNWKPYLADTLRQMRADGIRRASVFITSAFGSYSGCRQYLDDLDRAAKEVGEGTPELIPMILFYDQPGFLDTMADRVAAALSVFASPPPVVYTAHSVPVSMADASPYVHQLQRACSTLSEKLGIDDWKLVYQSRSGPPSQPWLEPDILDHIRGLHDAGVRELVIVPIGFVSDHMEVLYDLDSEAADLCGNLGIRMVRAGTVGIDERFVRMIRDLIPTERKCAPDCCPRPQRPSLVSVRSEPGSDRSGN